MWPLLREMLFCRALNTFDVLSETEKASIPLGDHWSSGHRSIYKLSLNEVLMVILWSLKLSTIDYENSRRHPSSLHLSTCAWRTLTMSSLNDLHCTKDDTSVTAPFISMETTLTGMATVRPVRTAVLIISVSWIWKKERGTSKARAWVRRLVEVHCPKNLNVQESPGVSATLHTEV